MGLAGALGGCRGHSHPGRYLFETDYTGISVQLSTLDVYPDMIHHCPSATLTVVHQPITFIRCNRANLQIVATLSYCTSAYISYSGCLDDCTTRRATFDELSLVPPRCAGCRSTQSKSVLVRQERTANRSVILLSSTAPTTGCARAFYVEWGRNSELFSDEGRRYSLSLWPHQASSSQALCWSQLCRFETSGFRLTSRVRTGGPYSPVPRCSGLRHFSARFLGTSLAFLQCRRGSRIACKINYALSTRCRTTSAVATRGAGAGVGGRGRPRPVWSTNGAGTKMIIRRPYRNGKSSQVWPRFILRLTEAELGAHPQPNTT